MCRLDNCVRVCECVILMLACVLSSFLVCCHVVNAVNTQLAASTTPHFSVVSLEWKGEGLMDGDSGDEGNSKLTCVKSDESDKCSAKFLRKVIPETG